MRKYTIQEKIAHLEARAASGLKMVDYAELINIKLTRQGQISLIY
ncbi:hypothetical protein [Thorsellia kenyensis]|uniref:Uncharacterized protein n=1 Tax=Thorsellia kenyensis TaxID=1549888 RepID=A0ABV6C880_9GAMM